MGSPFDYPTQMTVVVPTDMPEPSDDVNYPRHLARAILHYTRPSGGRTLVLFTSTAAMRAAAREIGDDLEREGIRLLMQGQGQSVARMIADMKSDNRSVLFGLDSFWTGVDIPGDDVVTVIITRLPFAVPDQPLVQARLQRLKDQGRNAFMEYTVPRAIIQFRQGAGRMGERALEDLGGGVGGGHGAAVKRSRAARLEPDFSLPLGEGRRAATGWGRPVIQTRARGVSPCRPHPVSAALRPPSPEGEGDNSDKRHRPSAANGCGEVDGAWAVARNRGGPLLSRYGDRLIVFSARAEGSVPDRVRERRPAGLRTPRGGLHPRLGGDRPRIPSPLDP